MPELRKRKALEPLTEKVAKKGSSINVVSTKLTTGSSPKKNTIAVGDSIKLNGFGGTIQTNEGHQVTLQVLIEQSKNGVVLFTYPKASTPGCTTQACLFRDDFESLTKTGLDLYGISKDSVKTNANFKTKQKLPYLLLCDPQQTLIAAIGMRKSPSGTSRGVVVIDKEGIVKVWKQAGPAPTVEFVRDYVHNASDEGSVDESHKAAEGMGQYGPNETAKTEGPVSAKVAAQVAAEVADTARKLDN